MKKIICKVALCLAVLCMGATFTSCGTDVVETILNYLTGGETYTYRGTYTMQIFVKNSETDQYEDCTGELKYEDTTVSVVAKKGTSFTPAGVDLTLPEVKLENGITMSEVTLSNLTLDETTLSTGDNSRGTGTLTYPVNVDGTTQQFDLSGVGMKAAISTDELQLEYVDVYYGSNDKFVVRVTMPDGKVVAAN